MRVRRLELDRRRVRVGVCLLEASWPATCVGPSVGAPGFSPRTGAIELPPLVDRLVRSIAVRSDPDRGRRVRLRESPSLPGLSTRIDDAGSTASPGPPSHPRRRSGCSSPLAGDLRGVLALAGLAVLGRPRRGRTATGLALVHGWSVLLAFAPPDAVVLFDCETFPPLPGLSTRIDHAVGRLELDRRRVRVGGLLVGGLLAGDLLLVGSIPTARPSATGRSTGR